MAAAGPAWTGGGGVRAGQVVFVLDVSGSMLAQDVKPDRLTAAKAAISSTCGLLPGDAVGLVAAGGAPVVACPVTTDRDVFRALLDRVDAGWASSATTDLAPALSEAGDLLRRSGATNAAVVLISDGENHGPAPFSAAVELRRRRIVTHCVCVGGEAATPVLERDLGGNPVPGLDAQGDPIVTRARPDDMREWAEAGGGRPWSVSVDTVDLPATRRDVLQGDPAWMAGAVLGGRELSTYLCLTAILMLSADLLLGWRRRAA